MPERPLSVPTGTMDPSRESVFRLLVESVREYAIFLLDPGGRVASWNPGAERLKGYAASEIVGQHFSRFYPPERDRTGIQAELTIALEKGQFREEGWRLRKDGSRFWADVTITPLRDEGGELRGFAKVTKDMTELKLAQDELQRTAELLTEAERLARIGSWEWDVPADHVRWSEELHRIHGVAPGVVRAGLDGLLERVHPDDRVPVEGELRAAVEERRGFLLEYRIVRPDGAERTLLAQGRTAADADGSSLRVVGTAQDITERKQAEAQRQAAEEQRRHETARREAEKRFRIMADTAPVMVRMSGPEGLSDWFNRPWLEFRGRSLEHELGQGWMDGVHPEDLPGLEAGRAAFARREPFRREYRLRGSDGEYRWVLEMAIPRFEDGVFAGYVASCIDITDRRAAEAERERLLAEARGAREQAEEASRLKDEFLATLSHELRSPLNAIVGWAHILDRGEVEDGVRTKAAETIIRNAQLQSRLIADILDISRIVAGKLRLSVGPVDLAAVVEQAVDGVRPAAEAKQIQLALHLDPAAAPAWGDPDRLQQVVWNLLSNAVKFTRPQGHVKVTLERDAGRVVLSVQDDGPGIPPTFLPYVFDRFRQADQSSTRRHGGLGLGLAIARNLVELHGGTITAENRLDGAGAVFRVVLPRLAVAPAAEAARAEPSAARAASPGLDLAGAPSIAGVRVLVVEDEADSRQLLAELLGRLGADVAAAASASEALDQFRARRPDVIVSDVEMPDEDGYALLRRLRALPDGEGRLTPAVALTAYARPEDRMAALRAGFQVHVSKPVDPGELVTIVARLADARLRGG